MDKRVKRLSVIEKAKGKAVQRVTDLRLRGKVSKRAWRRKKNKDGTYPD